jgi:hypothetical protein
MTNRRRIYFAAWIVSVLVAIAPLSFSANRQQYLEFLMPILAILALIIVDNMTSMADREELKTTIERFGHDAVANSQVVITLRMRDALAYVAANAARATRIYNTRLARRQSEITGAAYMNARNGQDEGFKRAIREGAEYHLVYDRTQSVDVHRFLEETARGRGIVHHCEVETSGHPFVQFIVLEYDEGVKECLVGYGLGDDITTYPNIYLVRNQELCEYLKYLHGAYRSSLRTANH